MKALTLITLVDQQQASQVLETLRKIPGVTSTKALIGGQYDLAIDIEADDEVSIAALLNDHIQVVEGIGRTFTQFVNPM